MPNEALRNLALEVGIAPEWQNIRGQIETVPDETLRAILAKLGIPSATQKQVAASLTTLRDRARFRLPSLVTATAGKMVPLSGIGRGSSEILMMLEGGTRERRIKASKTVDGISFRAPRTTGYHRIQVDRQEAVLAVAPSRGITSSERTGREKSWGLVTQLYSLSRPGDGGVGDFSSLSDLARSCANLGGSGIAVSPLHAQFSADPNRFSPYSPSSRLWLNALHIDVSSAFEKLGMSHLEPPGLPQRSALIDWQKVSRRKIAALRRLFDLASKNNRLDDGQDLGSEFHRFCQEGGASLRHHALFEALHAHFLGQSSKLWYWRDWPLTYRDPQGSACGRFADEHRQEIAFHMFLQWLAACQLQRVGDTCKEAGMPIGLIGDIAVGVDDGGSQAWANTAEMLAGLSIGAPPDDFNPLGQNWGVTTFSPLALKEQAGRSFIDLLRHTFRYAGGVRIDHILGLSRLWVVPAGGSARQGAYLHYPLQDMLRLTCLESRRSGGLVIGEDLGTVPPGFRDQLDEHAIMGMQVLWFQQQHGVFIQPDRWKAHAVGMTSTHDLPTIAGWWSGTDLQWKKRIGLTSDKESNAGLSSERRQQRQALWAAFKKARVVKSAPPAPDAPELAVDAAIRFLAKTACSLLLIPLEDVLALREQPNLPGTVDQHPNWRRRITSDAGTLLHAEPTRRRLRPLKRRES